MRSLALWRRPGAALSLAVGAAMVLALAAWPPPAAADKIHVPPPPPPPPPDNKPKPAYDYKHDVKKTRRDRKLVVALLRPGDVVELKDYLPFGRGVGITDTQPDGTKSQTVIKTGREDEAVRMPAPIRQFLARELLLTREFLVLERERILEIARELALAKTDAVDKTTAPRPGRLIGVHYIIEGAYYPVGGLPPGDPALAAVRREIQRRRLNLDPAAACVMYLTVYKVETGEVRAVACGADLQPLVAVQRAVEDLCDQLRDVAEPVKVAAVNPDTGMALLDIGAEEGVKPGDVFTLGGPPGAGPAPGTAPAAAGAPAAGAASPEATPLKAEVVRVEPLSSVVKIVSGDKTAVREGQQARPAPAPPSAP